MTNMDATTDWVDGKVGSGALDFDGSNDYVDAGSSSSLRFHTGDFTVTGWIKSDSLTGTRTLGATYLDVNTGWFFGTFNSKLGYYTNAWKSANTTLVTGQWYHIGITVDASGNYIFYLNGNSDGSGASTLPANTTESFKIGAYGASGGLGRFDGLIDEVRIYNRALSADEVMRLYKATSGTKISSSLSKGLVGYWNFDINAGGDTVYDMSTSANHGTMINMDPATDWVDGKVGSGALDFDGSNDYVDLVNKSNLEDMVSNANVNKTLSVWFNANTLVAESVEHLHPSLISKGNVYMNFGVDNSGEVAYMWSDGGVRIILTSGAGITTGNWYHATITFDGAGTFRIYVDGVEKGSGTFTGLQGA